MFKLQVTSSSYKFKLQVKLQVKITSYKLRLQVQITSYKFKLQVTSSMVLPLETGGQEGGPKAPPSAFPG